jgi:hypothetical protein
LFNIKFTAVSFWRYTRTHIYRMSQEEKSVFWGGHSISRSNVYMYMCPIPNGFRDRAISLCSPKIVDKVILRTVSNTRIYCSSDKVGRVYVHFRKFHRQHQCTLKFRCAVPKLLIKWCYVLFLIPVFIVQVTKLVQFTYIFGNSTVNINALCNSCEDMACCSSLQCTVKYLNVGNRSE